MDTTTTIYKPPLHEHPLFPFARFIYSGRGCDGCNNDETMYGGYFCNDYDCEVRFHKKCAEAPLEINHHPSHPQHPLLLTNDYVDGLCDLCENTLSPPCYSCSSCEFKVDFTCGMKLSPPEIKHPLCHDHPLVLLEKPDEETPCEVCKLSYYGPIYSCLECDNVYFHMGCVDFSKEVNHPCHFTHPLKLIASDTLTNDAEKSCLICEEDGDVIYHCSICNFTTCLRCTRNPPPLVIEHIKTHKHPLTRLSRRVLYTCDACGLESNTGSYICIQCDFVIHGTCIDLPRVININRHDHRISFTHHLGAGYSNCGVCRQSLSQYHGAYSCSVCPNYAAHSKCVVKDRVWDGVELEGIPDDTEDVAPFKVVGDDLINHFSHDKHPLKLHKNNDILSKWLRCEACIYPVCEECGFVLHEKCANLPMKRRLIFSTAPYKLKAVNGPTYCDICKTISHGFKYSLQAKYEWRLDVHCGSLSEPLFHDGHLHPLYFHLKDYGGVCGGCHYNVKMCGLRCDVCGFVLCFYCATLPLKIWHRNDEHPLTLCWGDKNASGKNWCGNCEMEIDTSKWFYTCSDCGVTLHLRCILGDFSRLKLEKIFVFLGAKFEGVFNNHNTRPLCSSCHSRCNMDSVILKVCDEDNGYICSPSCLRKLFLL